jgi:hypothetical protein
LEKEAVDKNEEASDTEEPNDGADDSQKCDDGKVLEKEGFSEAVACREDDGGKDDGEEDLIVEGDLLFEGVLRNGGSDHTHENGHGGLVDIWDLFEFDNVRSKHIKDQDDDEDAGLS